MKYNEKYKVNQYEVEDFVIFKISGKEGIHFGSILKDNMTSGMYEYSLSNSDPNYDFMRVDEYVYDKTLGRAYRSETFVYRKDIIKSFGKISYRKFKDTYLEYFV